MSRLAWVVLFSLVSRSGLALAAPDPKIAVVDIQKALSGITHWKEAVDKLEKQRASMQASLEKRQATLRERKEKIDAQKAVSDPKATVDGEEDLLKEAQVLAQEFMASQQRLLVAEKQVQEQILGRIQTVAQEIALADGYTFVFERGTEAEPNVLYMSAKIDVTAEVVKRYGQRFKDQAIEVKLPDG